MSEEESCKILICGDVCGQFKTLYTRIRRVLAAAGSFEALFCVGDFFGENGEEFEKICEDPSTIPIMTYVLCLATPTALRFITDLNGCELCPSIKYLGQQGTYTTISGLRIVYVSVSPNVEADSDTWVTEFPSLEADPSFSGVDLLLTCQWPAYIVPSNDPLSSKVADQTSLCVAHIAKSVKPRYHFVATNGVFYERKPYRNHRVLQEKEKLVTRFIALAKVGNKGNAKYLYALKVKPVDKMSQIELCAQPPDVTDNPYFDTLERTTVAKPKETEVQTEQYFYATSKKRAADGDNDRKRTDWKLKKYDSPHFTENTPKVHDACWFCLGNPQVAKHLLVTIATHAYLALPRGPLVKDHVLILTVGHHQSWLTCSEVVQADIEAYKSSLRAMFKEEGKVMVTFERNYKTHHYQLQVVPVPFAVAGEVKKAFLEMSESLPNSPCKLEQLPRSSSISDFCKPGIPYFYVELPTGEKLFNKIERDRVSSSDVNFGRAVLASEAILNCPERVNWRECTESEEVETQLAAEMRSKFAAFDFT
ncbi:CWF19-like protein [Echinococcus granulosus]|uniref:CWF19-like protein n=1 Tax=Echinococcus granulosus TaxID=6210 RepID=W6UDV6_ECHGR|nr:CWF19-like protein [Echinococcus granulosus]EUB59021.1 CWF19-like protein [Echinococcus granulosus]